MWKEYFDFSFGYLVVSQQLVIMAVLDPTLFDHVGLWLEPLGNRCMVELCLLSRKTKVWTYFFRWKRRLAEKLSVKLKLAGLIKLMPEKVVHLCSLLAVTTQSAHAWTNSWALTIRNLTWRTRLAPLSEKKGKCWLCSPQLIINISQRLWSSWSQDQPSATHTKKKENCHLHAARC